MAQERHLDTYVLCSICCSEWHEARCYAVTVVCVCVVSLCAGNKVNHSPHAIATISSPPLRHHDTSSGLLIAAAENTENTDTGAGAAILDTGRQDTTTAVND